MVGGSGFGGIYSILPPLTLKPTLWQAEDSTTATDHATLSPAAHPQIHSPAAQCRRRRPPALRGG